MNKLLKIFLILFGVGIFAAFLTYLYVFHKPHRNIAKEKPAFTLQANELYNEFTVDENGAYLKYGDQVIQTNGEVVEYSLKDNGASIMLIDQLEGINCSFDSVTVAKDPDLFKTIKEGEEVTLKGKCDGYDMIMGVVLTRCVLLNVETSNLTSQTETTYR